MVKLQLEALEGRCSKGCSCSGDFEGLGREGLEQAVEVVVDLCTAAACVGDICHGGGSEGACVGGGAERRGHAGAAGWR